MTFAVGYAGFVVFRRVNIPNPALLGSMFATGMMNIAGYYPVFPTWGVSFVSNILIGAMLGRQIDRRILTRIRGMFAYVALQVSGMLLLSLAVGYTLYRMTGLPIATALLGGSAGGIAEMSAFGLSIDADAVIIALIQLFRIVIFLSLIPFLSLRAQKAGMGVPGVAEKKTAPGVLFFLRRDYVMLGPAAFLGASLLTALKVPTGALIGAMIACGLFSICIGKTYRYDMNLRYMAQIGLGLVMGQRVSDNTFVLLETLLVPVLVSTTVMLAGCLAMAFLLHRTSGWDLVSCLLCSAPAGISQITSFADEIGADSFTVSVFHSVRIIGIVCLYPWIITRLM
jgi:membrane AbrB-like protein